MHLTIPSAFITLNKKSIHIDLSVFPKNFLSSYRAVNNGLLDTYQLKSLDGVLEAPMEEVKVTKDNNKFRVTLVEKDSDKSGLDMYDNFALRDSYDRVIRCLGWQFDDSLLRK